MVGVSRIWKGNSQLQHLATRASEHPQKSNIDEANDTAVPLDHWDAAYYIGLSRVLPENSVDTCALFPSFHCCRQSKIKSALKGESSCNGQETSSGDCLSVLGIVSTEHEEVIEKKEVRFAGEAAVPGSRRVSPAPGAAMRERAGRPKPLDAMWDREMAGLRQGMHGSPHSSVGNRSSQQEKLGSPASPKALQRFAQRFRSSSPTGPAESSPASADRLSRSPGRRIQQLVQWATSSREAPQPRESSPRPVDTHFLQSPRSLPSVLQGVTLVEGDLYNELVSSAVDAAAAAGRDDRSVGSEESKVVL